MQLAIANKNRSSETRTYSTAKENCRLGYSHARTVASLKRFIRQMLFGLEAKFQAFYRSNNCMAIYCTFLSRHGYAQCLFCFP